MSVSLRKLNSDNKTFTYFPPKSLPIMKICPTSAFFFSFHQIDLFYIKNITDVFEEKDFGTRQYLYFLIIEAC